MKALLLTPLLLFPLTVFASAEERSWTNKDGQTMEAKLVSVQSDTVVFAREDRTYEYPIANLSEEDQKLVRERAEEEKKAAAVANELQGQLVRWNRSRFQKVDDADISGKRLFAFYYSAHWCGPCRNFTPDLVSFYNEIRESYPEFEVVFVSSDRDEKAMKEYMRDFKMDFPAVRFERKDRLAAAQRHKQRGIPNLVFVDGSGEPISQSYANGRYVGPRKVLQDIRQHLAGG